VASRYSPDELALLHGRPTARPAGPGPAAAAALQGAAVVEVDQVVKTLPSPVPAELRHRLPGARVAGLPPEPAAGPVVR
jgi:hypothetical protein